MFANQKSSRPNPGWSAQRVGLDPKEFQKLLDTSDLPSKKIKEDTEQGALLRLSSTPRSFSKARIFLKTSKASF